MLVAFAAGILGSMSLFGVALAGVLSTRALQRVGLGAGLLVGLSSIVLGVAWVASALFESLIADQRFTVHSTATSFGAP